MGSELRDERKIGRKREEMKEWRCVANCTRDGMKGGNSVASGKAIVRFSFALRKDD